MIPQAFTISYLSIGDDFPQDFEDSQDFLIARGYEVSGWTDGGHWQVTWNGYEWISDADVKIAGKEALDHFLTIELGRKWAGTAHIVMFHESCPFGEEESAVIFTAIRFYEALESQ